MKVKYIVLALAAMLAGVMFTACEKDTGNTNVGDTTGNTEEPTPQQALNGFDVNGASLALFSVSPTKQVRFSRGNLQYQASTGTWRFAEHQYDYVADGNRNISSTYDGWIDLFGWGTSGWAETGDSIHNPWDTLSNGLTHDIVNDYAEGDWAWHNAIQNGGNRTHMWRTLTNDEWKYLLDNRTDAVNKRGAAMVEDVHGMVILPDDWTTPDSLTFTAGFNGWTTNQYSISEWQRMETSGAVFLPAAGCRMVKNVVATEECGMYWSSTIHDGDYASYLIVFYNNQLTAGATSPQPAGRSVRPVMDNIQ